MCFSMYNFMCFSSKQREKQVVYLLLRCILEDLFADITMYDIFVVLLCSYTFFKCYFIFGCKVYYILIIHITTCLE